MVRLSPRGQNRSKPQSLRSDGSENIAISEIKLRREVLAAWQPDGLVTDCKSREWTEARETKDRWAIADQEEEFQY